VLGGRVETGETVQQALIRELREEVGLTVRSFRELAVLSDPEGAAHPIARYHIHVVDEWDDGEPTMQGHEHTELRWFRIDEACALRDLALPEYRDLFQRLGS
jgi:8-oxo-dGTP pyrophosphatase MutT (NUDIX family)